MLSVLDWRWEYPGWVHLVWVALAATVAVGILDLRGRDALGRILSPLMQHRLVDRVSTQRRFAKWCLLFAGLATGILALMQPYRRGERLATASQRSVADIIVALDVSKSMLAEDTAPNRLGRAKAEIGSLVDRLDGHRIGLVAFAGRAVTLSPLTSDYGFFRMILRGTDTTSVSRGGTRIGDALREAIDGFPEGAGAKLIILITDGEDHESFPVDAAKDAKDRGIRIFAVGFGSEEGSPNPITDPKTGAKRPVIDKSTGQPVESKLDGDLLRKLSDQITDGIYVPAKTSALDLDSIRREHIEPIVDADTRAARRGAKQQLYPWFVLASLITLLGAAIAARGVSRRTL